MSPRPDRRSRPDASRPGRRRAAPGAGTRSGSGRPGGRGTGHTSGTGGGGRGTGGGGRGRSGEETARFFCLTVPGLGAVVERQIASLQGIRVTGQGNDGRADVVLCEAYRDDGGPMTGGGLAAAVRALRGVRTVEDVFVEVGRTLRSEGDRAPWIARRLWRPARVSRAYDLWRRTLGDHTGRGAGDHQRRGSGTTYRVIARVLQERAFPRTALRRAYDVTIRDAEPTWRSADPARLELWVLEYDRGRFVAGVRVTTASARQRGGRDTEREGALRPAVAAAMVALAGPGPGSASLSLASSPGALLDPCCGSGTVLAEAVAAGWRAYGLDIDLAAVAAARRNVNRAVVEPGDARELTDPDGSVDAVVSNLPFGRQYTVPGDRDAWLGAVLGEIGRVTRPGGRVVLLVPELPPDVRRYGLRMLERHRLRLLGTATTLWAFRRA